MTTRQDPTHPTGISHDTPRGNSEVARARERKANAALEMKIEGWGWDEIAETVGYPNAKAAIVATELALEQQLKSEESKKHMRKLAGRRLERLIRSAWSKADDEESPEHLRAISEVRLLIDRHAKLYGYDAPSEVIVTNPTTRQIDEWVSRNLRHVQPDLEEGDVFEGEWFEGSEEPESEVKELAAPSE
jgi:hypothetical protein